MKKIRDEVIIVLATILGVIAISLIAYGMGNAEISGLAVGDFTLEEEEENISYIITKEVALEEIAIAEELVVDMRSKNFTAVFVEGALNESKRIFELVGYAEILRNSSSSEAKMRIAREKLRLVDWRGLYYDDVLIYTVKVAERRDIALRLNDLLEFRGDQVLDDEITGETGKFELIEEANLTEVIELIEEARIAFNDERYEDTERLLEEARIEYESRKLEAVTLVALKSGAKTAIQEHLWLILIILGLIGSGGYFYYKKLKINRLENKIKRTKIERQALVSLIKQTQIGRFRTNKISGLTYNIRMSNYKKKIANINQNLPVLEEKLIRLKNKRLKNEKEIKK